MLRIPLLLILLVAYSGSVTRADDRPNILFIIADDASRDSMGVYGSTYVQTPNFDRIAREGVRFEQAYNCNPKCAPARACLLTGRYSWQLEEACNHNPFLSDKWKFFPYLLEDAGYFVGFTGKGWGPGIYEHVDVGKSGFKNPNPAGYPYNELTLKAPFKGISKTDYGGNFDAFLDAKPENQPFCFWLGTREPHRGYEQNSWKKQGRDLSSVTVPEYYPDNETIRGDLADYAIEVEWYDKWIGHALESLEQEGLLENTLILVTSDHGMPFPRVKGQIYDDGFHVPLVARWGAKIQPGRVVTDFVTFPDVAPTILEAAGLTAHPQMTGASFIEQLFATDSGRIDESRDHTLLGKERHDIGRTDGDLLSVAYPARAIRTDEYLYVRNFKPERWPVGNPEYGLLNCDGSPTKSYLTGLSQADPEFRFYQMSFGKRPLEELYDMQQDPDCVENLAASDAHKAIKTQLWAQLRAELVAQGDPRVLGRGDIFDFYPYSKIERQQSLYGRPDYDPVQIFEEKYGETEQPGDSEDDLSVLETDSTISIISGGRTLLCYNKIPPKIPDRMDAIYARSGFLHPVYSPAGAVVTAAYPADHPHQNGIFAAWVNTTYAGQKVDFWNLGKGKGRVRHQRVVSTSRSGFEVELVHQALLAKEEIEQDPPDGTTGTSAVDVLRDHWKLEVVSTNSEATIFDVTLHQSALTERPLVIKEYHYGGLAVRGPGAWIIDPKQPSSEDAQFLNNLGSKRAAGNHEEAKWVCMTGEGQRPGELVTIAVMSHPSNFRAPQPARLHPSKPYFCFAPCFSGTFRIDREHPYHGHYRFIVLDGEPDPTWLHAQYAAWVE